MKPSSNLIRVFKFVFWLLAALFVLLLIVAPLLTAALVNAGQVPLSYVKYLRAIEVAQTYMMRGLGCVWLFFLGSCFASFLNVVAWRVPRGRGINGSSMCPYCNNKLRFSDNLPIFGWIRNGGQCRDCRLPISPRYLIVEFILGAIFLLICSVTILAGGINLPLRPIERLTGFEHLIFAPKWDLIQITSYHLVLICLLFTFALIRSEGLKLPIILLVAGLVFGIAMPLIWPVVLCTSWHLNPGEAVSQNQFSLNQALTLIAGLAVGLDLGCFLAWANSAESKRLQQKTNVAQSGTVPVGVASLALVGLFLGWQSAISVTIFALAISLCHLLVRKQSAVSMSFNFATRILLATLLHLLSWRLLTQPYWPSQPTSIAVIIVSVAVAIWLGICVRRLNQAPLSNVAS